MGLAAGQARLLSITARLTDNENNGQALSYAKQKLADQAEQINNEYLAALSATKLQVLTGFNGAVPNYSDITYGLITGYNSVACGKQYIVTDTKGKVLVSNEYKKAFEAGNGDYNTFLEKLGYSQVDISVNATTDEEKAILNEKVHEAWDKYIRAVGLSFYEEEHDTENPDVTFGYDKTVGYPYYVDTNHQYEELYSATFINDDGNGKPLIDELLVGRYQMTQRIATNNIDGNKSEHPQYRYGNEKISPTYEFTATNKNGETYIYRIYNQLIDNDVNNPDGHLNWYKYEYKNGSYIQSQDNIGKQGTFGVVTSDYGNTVAHDCIQNVTSQVISIKEKGREIPLNFDGYNKDQRQLYDYAVALTKAQSVGVDTNLKTAEDANNANYIKYLRNIFDAMATFGYYTSEDIHLQESETIKDDHWFEQQLRDGKLLLRYYSISENNFVSTSISEDEAIQEVEDERKIALVEAKYTQDTNALESKDKKIDLELKKLDTEHSALQTEYEALKGVVDKNIEKSFNMFS